MDVPLSNLVLVTSGFTMTVLLDMPAFKVSQFADNFLLPLVELMMVIRLFLRPFMMVSDSSWFSEWPHFLVEFA
jgi:predicted neutral ceramidase superfamily lipid hydrolase